MDDDMDINDFIRLYCPETATHWPNRIERALSEAGMLVFSVECSGHGVWKVVVARTGPADYRAMQEMEDKVRPVLRSIGVLRPRMTCTIFPVGRRWGIGFVFRDLAPQGIRYRTCSRRGQVIENRQHYQPLPRGR